MSSLFGAKVSDVESFAGTPESYTWTVSRCAIFEAFFDDDENMLASFDMIVGTGLGTTMFVHICRAILSGRRTCGAPDTKVIVTLDLVTTNVLLFRTLTKTVPAG